MAQSVLLSLVLLAAAQEYLPDLPVEHPAIRYFERDVDDPVARLDGSTFELRDDELGILPALLERLGIRVDSQALVFSKTSFQASEIAPDNPRAIFFSDAVAVAYVRGSELVEIASVDPVLGPVFYSANLRNPTAGFERREVCLQCHQGPATSGVPGIFVGSVFPGPSGKPSPIEAIITDHRTAFDERWGGWYVNATRGQQRDRANTVASSPADPYRLDPVERNLTHLYGRFHENGYLAFASDIVALMTFEHQTQMQNFITRVGWEARIVAHDGGTDRRQLDADIDALVAYMLFEDEVPLPEPVEGVSTFASTFPQRGPRDENGRSLRDFDLETRLFRYPLSYMIYSESFDALPSDARDVIYRKLFDALSETDIVDILRDTKPGLPEYWSEEP